MDIRRKLAEARNEYFILEEQFQFINPADSDGIDKIIFKINAKEKEIDALKDQVMLDRHSGSLLNLKLRTTVLN